MASDGRITTVSSFRGSDTHLLSAIHGRMRASALLEAVGIILSTSLHSDSYYPETAQLCSPRAIATSDAGTQRRNELNLEVLWVRNAIYMEV